MNWLYYLTEANIYLGVFYLAYCLFLTKETYYQLTRAYLLFACVVSFILPLLQIGALRPVETAVRGTITYSVPAELQQQYIEQQYKEAEHPITPVKTSETVITTISASPVVAKPIAVAKQNPVVIKSPLTAIDYLIGIYIVGAFILCLVLMIKLFTLFKLTRKARRITGDEYQLVYLPETNVAFSFFNYLFIGAKASGSATIIRHELVHIRQKHSLDIMFLEVVKILSWFNPFVYLLQNSLKTVHEYIADEQTAAYEADALTYSSFLVNNAYGAGGSSLTHSFFNYNLLKKRIIMLNQQRSGNLAKLKYLVTVPICAALLCVSTLGFSKTYALVDLDPVKASSSNTIQKKYLYNTAKTDDAPIELSGTDNGDISLSGDKFEADTVALVDDNKSVDEDHPPIPMQSAGGYDMLNRHLLESIHYKPADGDKGGLVVMSFTVGAGRKITDLKIATSDGEVLDNLALNAFKSYKGIINDDEGKTLKFGVFFFTDDYSIFKRPYENDPANSGWVTVSKYGFHPAVTSKGYEYVQWAVGGGQMLDGKLKRSVSKVNFTDKNGQPISYSADTATPEDLKVLKDKYGYVFPSNTYWAMGDVQDLRSHKYIMVGMDLNSYLNEPYANDFYNHIFNDLKYPAQEKTDGTAGAVLLKFNLDQNGTPNNWAVAKSGGEAFDQAALDVMNSYSGTIDDKAGTHTIAVVFCAVKTGKRPKVDESWKKTPGYVGEVAHGEEKPVIFSFTTPKKQ